MDGRVPRSYRYYAEGQSASVPGHDVSITQPGEAFQKLAQENENLKAQIIAGETLSQVRKLREQESEARQQLDQKVQSLTASHEDLARQLAQKREREQELQKNSAQQQDQLKAFAENAAKLDSRLRQASDEVESLKEERARLEAEWRTERGGLEEDFRAQLDVAMANLDRAEAALEKEADRSRNLEDKLKLSARASGWNKTLASSSSVMN